MANDIVQARKSAYELYAEQAAGGPSFVGDLLKFTKQGDWVAGREERELPDGTKMIVGVQTLQIGWIKWSDGKPAIQNMVLVEDIDSGAAEMPPLRDALGDDDPAMWERDDRGVPIDPWVLTNSIVLFDPEDSQLYTFSTRSKGGISAIGRVIKAYTAHAKHSPNEVPTVELGSDSYPHPKKEYGKIMIPLLNVLEDEWVEMPDEITSAERREAGSDDGPKLIEAKPKEPKPSGQRTPPPKSQPKLEHKPKGKVKVVPPPVRGQKRNGPQKGVRF